MRNYNYLYFKIELLWILLIICELILLISFSESTLHAVEIPVVIRFSYICDEFSLLLLAVVISATPPIIIRNLIPPRKSKSFYFSRFLLFSYILTILSFYIVSWSSFQSNGHFLNVDGISFFITNNLQLIKHILHLESFNILLPLTIIFLSSGAIWFIITFNYNIKRRIKNILHFIVIFIAIILLIGKFSGKIYHINLEPPILDHQAGMVYTMGDLLFSARNEKSGPLIHFLDSLSFISDKYQIKIEKDNTLTLDYRPIISLDEYHNLADKNFKKKNIILVIIESLRTDQLLAGGSDRVVLENIEAIIPNSTVFINNYSQASHSNYADLCPLSSHYPLRSVKTHVYPENPSYPRVLIYDILKSFGYKTAIISSQNENWGKMINYLNTGSIDHFFHSETWDGPTYIPRRDTGFEAFLKGTKRSGKIDDRFTVSEAIQWIDTVGDEPFFIYMNLQSSHVPYETPLDFKRKFGTETLPFSIGFNDFPPQYAPAVKDQYANSLAYVDFQLGKLFQYLKKSNRLDNSILVITGDTGQAFYEHGFAAHANKIFEESMRVPLIIYGSDLKNGIRYTPSQHIDIPPTILESLGLPKHSSFQGESLYNNRALDRPIYLMAQSPLAHQFGIIKYPFKYIYDVTIKKDVLFKLSADPKETTDVSSIYPNVKKSLSGRLAVWYDAQISYYNNVSQNTRFYPPTISN